MSLFSQSPNCFGAENNIRPQAIAGNVRCLLFDGSFDAIKSPQYLNFSGSIPEPKDSFFERKMEADVPAIKLNAKKKHKLPMDCGQDDIRYYDPETKEEAARDDAPPEFQTMVETPKVENDSEMESKENVIESVKKDRKQWNLMTTSTPFRFEPLPWVIPERPRCTKPRPFSFEERQKQLQQRKADQLKMIIQAEKEARKFRARPIPNFLKKNKSTKTPTEKESSESQMSQTAIAPPVFRAKSPTVLRRAPFKPILPRQHLIPQPFILHSELRAEERAVFDNYVKERQRLDGCLKELMQENQKRREQEEILRLRKAMVPKAQPIRKFKAVDVRVPKRPCTEPITPQVLKRQRR